MQRPDELEQRLSSLSLTHTSDSYLPRGNSVLAVSAAPARSLWPVRLNYALGFCLLLSVVINVIQFEDKQTLQTAVADQCELHSTLPDHQVMSPVAGKQPVYEKSLFQPADSGLWC